MPILATALRLLCGLKDLSFAIHASISRSGDVRPKIVKEVAFCATLVQHSIVTINVAEDVNFLVGLLRQKSAQISEVSIASQEC